MSTMNATEFITRWNKNGGSERANYQIFINDLCDVLGMDKPEPSSADSRDNAYVFERRVIKSDSDGSQNNGFIDCYKRGYFILEAKASRNPTAKKQERTMEAARAQADAYARALDGNAEGRPVFLVIVDVGNVIELFADFTQSGGTYIAYPDATNRYIRMQDLADQAIQARLKAVWTDPLSLDPARISAKVTRDVANVLATIAKRLEQKYTPEEVAGFLTRCLFTFFAEDAGLLPKRSFTELLQTLEKDNDPEMFVAMVGDLWRAMDKGGISSALHKKVLHFNGKLFKQPDVLPLERDDIAALIEASRADWTQVEPAIFGTLLERALDPAERHSLGAHYTPRSYVERLVTPTLIEPLRYDWNNLKLAALILHQEGNTKDAVRSLREFLYRLCQITVLDPACGSANFLYVALEQLKRLEDEVLDFLRNDLEQTQNTLEGEGLTVDPHQFLGIELNPRAAAIAELVLWIGYLQWHFRTHGHTMPPQPVLRDFKNIECRDAVLAWDSIEPLLDKHGQPQTHWDGNTRKQHPVTGELVPDDSARVPLYRYINPRPAVWPQADYIIGNPPFIGAAPMRAALGDGYVEALRSVYPAVPDSADLVMFWWHKAAEAVRAGHSQRFGLITTNSIKQTFNRRLLQHHLQAEPPLALCFAVPDHPWVDSADGAAVRIAMTVGSREVGDGTLLLVEKEWSAGGEGNEVTLAANVGRIHADLRIGADVAGAVSLRANESLTSRGLMLFGAGFILEQEDADRLRDHSGDNASAVIRPYRNGKDLTGRPRGVMLIDTFGMNVADLRSQFPAIYQWLAERVKPERDQNKDKAIRENWWLHGRQRPEIRQALAGLPRYIATVETAKHRVFQFLDASIAPDNKLIAIALHDAANLGVLSSRVHTLWAFAAGSTLEDRPVYVKTTCFETFPFPDALLAQAAKIGQLAEQIDAHRKKQQAVHVGLTLTNVYNVLEKLRSGETLNAKEQTINTQGLVGVLDELHNELDSVVLAAYGWSDLAPALVGKPGGLTPQVEKAEELAAAEETLLQRLAALNLARWQEEQDGTVRWLRSDFQNPEGASIAQSTLLARDSEDAVSAKTKVEKQAWPDNLPAQVEAVRVLLHASMTPLADTEIVARFKGAAAKKRLPEILDMLVTFSRASRDTEGRYRAL